MVALVGLNPPAAAASTVQTIQGFVHVNAAGGTPAFDVRVTVNMEVSGTLNRVYPNADNGIRVYTPYNVAVQVLEMDAQGAGFGVCPDPPAQNVNAYPPMTKVCDANGFDLTWWGPNRWGHFLIQVWRGGGLVGHGYMYFPNYGG
jgi:hypothetical protein